MQIYHSICRAAWPLSNSSDIIIRPVSEVPDQVLERRLSASNPASNNNKVFNSQEMACVKLITHSSLHIL